MSAGTAPLPSLDAACRLAEAAGQAILEVYARKDFEIECKSDQTPLTAADLASHRLIVDGLGEIEPQIPILSEESADIAWVTRRGWSRYWLVDPLDGTREFIKRNGEFTVNIALIDGHQSVLGVVLAPVTVELYYASTKAGTFFRRDGETVSLGTRAAREPLVVAGSRSHGSERQAQLLASIGKYTKVAMGSSLKFCLIARGDADLYLRPGPTSEWDTAAAQCVLEQAGGAVTQFDGTRLAYNTKASLLNPEFMAVGDPTIDWPARLSHDA
jgi:3'(2'), 5'-bisphosphate nucleotidase